MGDSGNLKKKGVIVILLTSRLQGICNLSGLRWTASIPQSICWCDFSSVRCLWHHCNSRRASYFPVQKWSTVRSNWADQA